MTQPALIGSPYDPPPATSSPLYRAAVEHLDQLRTRGLLKPEHELLAQLTLHLAQSAAAQVKAYALAQIAKELRECIAQLPSAELADPFDQLTEHLSKLDQTQADA